MNKITLIIIGSFVFMTLLLLAIVLIMKNKKKKNILATLDRLTTEKNLIISSVLITELAKASKLANNKKIEEDIESEGVVFESDGKIDLKK